MGEFWASAHHKVLGLACCHGGSLPVVSDAIVAGISFSGILHFAALLHVGQQK